MPEVVVITGASAGVGRATVREFARRAASIGLIARGVDRLQATAREVEQLGGRAHVIATDVADPEALDAAAAEIERVLGPIDIWINNAMTTVFGRVRDLSFEELERVTDVCYHGTVWGTMAALKRMTARNRGVILQVGSALAYRAIPLQSAYCGAKHAVRAFTDSLRSELIHDGIDIDLVMVQLPGLNTPQFSWCRSYMPYRAQPVPPIYQPEVAARAIWYAAHHPRREVYVGRAAYQTIFGQKVAPGVLDHYLADKAFEGQQRTELPEPEQRPSNLFEPVVGDWAARGEFNDRATDSAASGWLGARLGAAGMRALAIATVVLLLVAMTALLLL